MKRKLRATDAIWERLLMFLSRSFPPTLLRVVVFLLVLPYLSHAELQNIRVSSGPAHKTKHILVTESGVVPDDGKDDSAALQALLDSSKEWTELTFPAGTYDISRTVNLSSQTILQGDLKGGSVLRFAGTAPCPMFQIQNGSYITLYDLTLDAAMNPNATQGMVVSQSNAIYIQNLTIRNFSAGEGFGPHAIFFSERVTNSVIYGCSMENIGVESPWGAGIRISKGSSSNTVHYNKIRNTGRGGILCNESPELHIMMNTIEGSHGEGLGIELWGGCPKSIVEDNTLDHWLSVDKSPQTAIRRNKISDPSGTIKAIGLELVDSSDCIFADNTVDGGQQIGISVSNTGPKERIYWARNTIRNCVTWNAQIQGEAGGATGHVFRQNTFEGALLNDMKAQYPGQGYGVRFNGNCHNMLFLENTIIGNGHGAFQTCGENLDSLRFVRNTIKDNKGPVLTGPLGVTPCWTGNHATNNSDDTLPPESSSPCMFQVSITVLPDAEHPGLYRFSCKADDDTHVLKQALWDFGYGIPLTGLEVTPAIPSNAAHVTVVAWDANGLAAIADKEVAMENAPAPPV